MIKKELYAAPETEVLELHLEGVIANSVTADTPIEKSDSGIGGWDGE